MASTTTNLIDSRATEPFGNKLLRVLEAMAKLSPTYRRLDALNSTSDAELAEQGITRQQAAERIFGNRLYV